jgi:hypothetical protein
MNNVSLISGLPLMSQKLVIYVHIILNGHCNYLNYENSLRGMFIMKCFCSNFAQFTKICSHFDPGSMNTLGIEDIMNYCEFAKLLMIF